MNGQEKGIFRKKSMESLSSPEQLNDYLRVTTPSVWAALGAAVLLLAALILWSFFAVVESYVPGRAAVKDGTLTITFDTAEDAQRVEKGMTVQIGDVSAPVTFAGPGEDGEIFATAFMQIPDGSYEARVSYRQTQVIRMLFN